MSSEYGVKSLEEMKAKQRALLQQAEKAHPCVAVTEPNWAAMIASQKAQIETLAEMQSTLLTLTTRAELTDLLNQQLTILMEHGRKTCETMDQYREQMMAAAKAQTRQMETAATGMQTQAGKISEQFSQQLSVVTQQQKRYTKKLFWISLIPSLLLLIMEWMPLIWQRIFPA